MKRFADFNLRKKFIISLLAFLILPLVVVSILMNNNLRSYYFKQACDSNIEVLTQVDKGVENFTKDLEFVSLNILSDETVQNLIKIYKGEYSNSVEREQLNVGFTIQSLLQSRDFVSSISIYENNNIIFQFGERVSSEDMEYNGEVQALKGRPYWTGAYQYKAPVNQKSNDYVISIIRVINDLYSMNNVLAIERISVKENYINSLYSSINIKGGIMYVADKNGNIVSSTDSGILGVNIINQTGFSDFFKQGSGYFQDGQQMVFFCSQHNPDWVLVKEVPLSVLYANSDIISMILFLCIGLIIIFAVAFMVIQNKSIIKPVVNLAYEADHFHDNNFKISRHSTNDDEIGRLNNSLHEMGKYIHNLIEREYKSKLSQREIELEYLNSQINPHFLYNALDSIRWMAIKENKFDVAKQIEALSQLFRHNLNQGNRITTLREELKHLENYIIIQKNRYGDKIDFKIKCDNELLDCVIIKLLLQPLVENAIVHGLEEKPGNGLVRINIIKKGDIIEITVRDNGIGTDAGKINDILKNSEQSNKIFALKNINDRIKLEYGEEYGMVLKSKKDNGTEVKVILPIMKKDDKDILKNS